MQIQFIQVYSHEGSRYTLPLQSVISIYGKKFIFSGSKGQPHPVDDDRKDTSGSVSVTTSTPAPVNDLCKIQCVLMATSYLVHNLQQLVLMLLLKGPPQHLQCPNHPLPALKVCTKVLP